MKLRTVTLLTLLLIFVIHVCDLHARGGRDGGGGGGGGNRGGGGSAMGGGGGNRGSGAAIGGGSGNRGGGAAIGGGGGNRGAAAIGGGGGNRGGNIGRSDARGGGNISRENRGSNSFSRAPTMSRPEIPTNRPAQLPSWAERPSFQPGQGSARPNEGARPAQGLKPSQELKPGKGLKPGQGAIRDNASGNNKQIIQDAKNRNMDRNAARDNAKEFLKDSKNRNFDKGTLDQKKKDFLSNRSERDKKDRLDSEKLTGRIKNNWHDYNKWFDRDFFDHHHYHPYYWNNQVNWWRAATWVGVAGWLSWGGGYPIYYDNGYYPIQAPDYGYGYQQPDNYTPPDANTLYPPDSSAEIVGDWYPLGVFAVGKNATLAANSHMFVQLALDKNGDIAGTYYNATTDQTHEIVGTVDKESQLAAWWLADNPQSPIVSTGLYNLTKDLTQVAIDFPDSTEQIWTYVRLEQ